VFLDTTNTTRYYRNGHGNILRRNQADTQTDTQTLRHTDTGTQTTLRVQQQASSRHYMHAMRPNNNMSQVDVSPEILGSCKQKLINLCFRAGRSSPIGERGIVTASTDSPDCFPTLLSMSVFTFQFFIFSTF